MNKALQKRQQQRIKKGNTTIIRNKYGSNQFSDNLIHDNNYPIEFDIITEDNQSKTSSVVDYKEFSCPQRRAACGEGIAAVGT